MERYAYFLTVFAAHSLQLTCCGITLSLFGQKSLICFLFHSFGQKFIFFKARVKILIWAVSGKYVLEKVADKFIADCYFEAGKCQRTNE